MSDILDKKQIEIADIANLLNKRIGTISHQIMVERVKPTKQFDFDWDDEGFIIYVEQDEDIDYSIRFSADVRESDYGGETVVEMTNMQLEQVEVDSYSIGNFELDIDDPSPLVAVAQDIVNNANYYKLVDDVAMTCDMQATKAEIERNHYDPNYHGMTNADFM